MTDVKLTPMFAYQGGKTKIANKIVEHIKSKHGNDFIFIDVCCGGGSLSIEMVNSGIPTSNIHMCDIGAIGSFWEKVGNDTFDMGYFEDLISKIPQDPKLIQEHLKKMSQVKYDTVKTVVYEYLILQAGAFGGKQIFDDGNNFSNTSFRSYWEPTETSSRRSPVNPMMPMPNTLLSRVKNVVVGMRGITAYHSFAESLDFGSIVKGVSKPVVVYIDPPYKGTTGYKNNVDLERVVYNAKQSGCHVYVSEYLKLSDECYVLSETKKGGISGGREGTMTEYLSLM